MDVLAGYDGSPGAGAAIDVAARLLPAARVWIAHVWTAPFASDSMRRRLWTGGRGLDAFIEAIEREGAAEAERVALTGVTLARSAGWTAETLVERGYAGEGLQLARLAGQIEPDLLVVGARGLGGVRAVLGSTSDMVVHYARQPVLVVPHPLFTAERDDLADGPVLVGWDGSAGARHAAEAARRLFEPRPILLAAVDCDEPGEPPPGYRVLHAGRPGGPAPAGRGVAAALTALAAEHRAAVVVVGSRGRSAVREIVLGSVAMATLHHAQRPVLVVHQPKSSGSIVGAGSPEGGEEDGKPVAASVR